jgi:hypothetical protein
MTAECQPAFNIDPPNKWVNIACRLTPAIDREVRRVFREFADGQSIFSIIKRLNEEGIRGRNNKVCRWSTGTIHTMLRNEKYKGIWTWNRTG